MGTRQRSRRGRDAFSMCAFYTTYLKDRSFSPQLNQQKGTDKPELGKCTVWFISADNTHTPLYLPAVCSEGEDGWWSINFIYVALATAFLQSRTQMATYFPLPGICVLCETLSPAAKSLTRFSVIYKIPQVRDKTETGFFFPVWFSNTVILYGNKKLKRSPEVLSQDNKGKKTTGRTHCSSAHHPK